MGKKRLIASIAASVLVAGSAQAATIAGWDFSQFIQAGFLSDDGVTLDNTFGANYSALDPTFQAGPDSGVFGTMYLNGQNGSTEIIPDASGTEATLPINGQLQSNLNAGVTDGVPSFDSLGVQLAEGAPFANLLSMVVQQSLFVVFSADLSSVPEQGFDWRVSFGGQTLVVGQGSQVSIEYSLDGVTYASAGSVNLTNADTGFSRALTTQQTDQIFVRLGFVGGSSPVYDNVRIQATLATVPEPATMALLLTGLLGLAGMGRRRA